MSPASSEFPLRGWYVISMRPLGGHAAIRRQASALGARAFALSTLRLVPLDAGRALDDAVSCPRVIVTSPAAAGFAGAANGLTCLPGQRWFALGRGTASALRRFGVASVEIPASGSDSESLLALPGLQEIGAQRIGLVTAPGGRGVIAPALRARGAEVVLAEVYRRETLPLARSRLAALARLPATTALLLTSDEAFQAAWQALDAATRRQWLSRPCVVGSPRLSTVAGKLGFTQCVESKDSLPGTLLEALAGYVQEQRFR